MLPTLRRSLRLGTDGAVRTNKLKSTRPLVERKETLRRYDYILIGAGSAGGVLAYNWSFGDGDSVSHPR